jgi:hypothetical protein
MALLRFPTVRDVYDAFPAAADDVGMPASDEKSLAFLESLIARDAWDSAVSFCAYMLPRRQAVGWGCQSLRRIQIQPAPPEIAAVDAAERWVREPEEEFRREALRTGMAGDVRQAGVWLAFAAGWSGGSMMPPEFPPMPAAPYQTARAVRAALLIAMTQLPQNVTAEVMRACLESAMRLAASDG